MRFFFLLVFCGLAATTARGVDSWRVLWEIGNRDASNAEFALAPRDYARFHENGFFVVGRSDPARDWPYVHPGPVDGWAGGVPHTFTVVFGIGRGSTKGACRLRIDLLDTHASAPPRLSVNLNGRILERQLAGGAGDSSVRGAPGQGRRQEVEFEFPARLLVRGENRVQLTTTSGSWLLYDGLALLGPDGVESAPVAVGTVIDTVEAVRALRRGDGGLSQPVSVRIRHFGEPIEAMVRVDGAAETSVRLAEGITVVELGVPPARRAAERTVTVAAGGRILASQKVSVLPVRPLTVYLLPHSHTDIGYTEIQTAIEDKQVENLRKGIEYARRTADYPEGARFVWNVEVLWAADLYLRRSSESGRQDFFDAVKKGQVVLNGMYLNELTGLCRTEELLRLFRYATELSAETGVPIDSVMISDVPGYTWGTVTAMAQAGLRYLSTAPNYFDRIGDILQRWENKPFWWIGPSGRERVLVWIPYKGYAMSHVYRQLTPSLVTEYQGRLDKAGYPFEIAYLRWSGHGDNAEPDPSICEFVKDWNGRYAWPRFVIAGTGEAFRAFEERYGRRIPEVRGDWTPYWEDGAGSSARETALNRATADRVAQAETLQALVDPAGYSATAFREAWNHVLLYSEHTWGAWCSVSDPESKATQEQWEIKRSYAEEADRRATRLLDQLLPSPQPGGEPVTELTVVNTTSWPRTDLVTVPAAWRLAGDQVLDGEGQGRPSQRLASGDLVFRPGEVPPFASRRYRLQRGAGRVESRPAEARGSVLENGLLRVRLDEVTGAISELTARGWGGNFVDASGGEGLNDFRFLPGDRLADLQRNGPVRIEAGERGPLVASLRVVSSAPGCRGLTREVRVVAGQNWVELINTVDKERAATPTRPNDWEFAQKGGKESVNFAFPFSVPGGELRLDLPVGVIRPEGDQIPSACKNWFTLGRWADVSNGRHGITWVSLDAPLVQVGGITATLVGSQSNPEVWRKRVEPTRRIYSWAMNNHWGTNYRAYQEGPVVFRYLLQPHGSYDPVANARLAIGAGQPLLATPAASGMPRPVPRLQVQPSDVLVSALKPSDDGNALIVRLYGASGRNRKARLIWADPQPLQMVRSDTSERALGPMGDTVEVPGHGLVTVRAELAR